MGQKVNPISLRLGINRTWDSRWFAAKGNYAKWLHQDLLIRRFLSEKFKDAALSRIIIERTGGSGGGGNKCLIAIHTARPGVVIGKKGEDVHKAKSDIMKKIGEEAINLNINVPEIRRPDTEALLVAKSIVEQLERRQPFRRAMKRAMQLAIRGGAQGIRISCGGRLGGAEIARKEWYREGRVPLHTLRADVDYASVPAHTTYGVCGVKVWIFKGEIMEHDPAARDKRIGQQQAAPPFKPSSASQPEESKS